MRTHSIVVPFTSETLDQYVAQLEAMAIGLAAEFTSPDAQTLRRLVRPNPARARQLMPLITRIAERFKVGSASMPVSDMADKIAFSDALRPVSEQAELVAKILREMIFVAEADAWTTLLATYGAMNAEARHNGLLDRALAPVRDAFTSNRRVIDVQAEPADTTTDGEGAPTEGTLASPHNSRRTHRRKPDQARRERAFRFSEDRAGNSCARP